MLTVPTRPLALLLTIAVFGAACASDERTGAQAGPGPTQPAATEEATPAIEATEAEITGAFPVEIDHAFGTTTIDAAPQRVVTWGWGSTDAAIALGVVPAAVPFDGYAGDEEGRLPWAVEAVEAMGAEQPEVLADAGTDEVPFEAIAAADPDVILAHYSGITEADYAILSDIAPTVAYPDAAWTTPWREVIEVAGQALGRQEEATQVLAEIDAAVAEATEEHPELAGLTVANVVDTAGTFYVYKRPIRASAS